MDLELDLIDGDLFGEMDLHGLDLIGLLDREEFDLDLIGLLDLDELLDMTEFDLDLIGVLDLTELDLDLTGLLDAEDLGLLGDLVVCRGRVEDSLSFDSSSPLLSLSSSCF